MAAAEPQTGNPPEQTPPQAPPAAAPATSTETVTREQYERDLDRYRNQFGQEKKKAEELAARLAELEEAGKSDADKIAAKAAEFDALRPRVRQLEAALATQVDEILPQLTEELRELVSADGPVEARLAQAKKLLAAQSKLQPQSPQPTLPEPGGRHPARSQPGTDDKKAYEEAAALFPTLARLQPGRRGP